MTSAPTKPPGRPDFALLGGSVDPAAQASPGLLDVALPGGGGARPSGAATLSPATALSPGVAFAAGAADATGAASIAPLAGGIAGGLLLALLAAGFGARWRRRARLKAANAAYAARKARGRRDSRAAVPAPRPAQQLGNEWGGASSGRGHSTAPRKPSGSAGKRGTGDVTLDAAEDPELAWTSLGEVWHSVGGRGGGAAAAADGKASEGPLRPRLAPAAGLRSGIGMAPPGVAPRSGLDGTWSSSGRVPVKAAPLGVAVAAAPQVLQAARLRARPAQLLLDEDEGAFDAEWEGGRRAVVPQAGLPAYGAPRGGAGSFGAADQAEDEELLWGAAAVGSVRGAHEARGNGDVNRGLRPRLPAAPGLRGVVGVAPLGLLPRSGLGDGSSSGGDGGGGGGLLGATTRGFPAKAAPFTASATPTPQTLQSARLAARPVQQQLLDEEDAPAEAEWDGGRRAGSPRAGLPAYGVPPQPQPPQLHPLQLSRLAHVAAAGSPREGVPLPAAARYPRGVLHASLAAAPSGPSAAYGMHAAPSLRPGVVAPLHVTAAPQYEVVERAHGAGSSTATQARPKSVPRSRVPRPTDGGAVSRGTRAARRKEFGPVAPRGGGRGRSANAESGGIEGAVDEEDNGGPDEAGALSATASRLRRGREGALLGAASSGGDGGLTGSSGASSRRRLAVPRAAATAGGSRGGPPPGVAAWVDGEGAFAEVCNPLARVGGGGARGRV